MEIAECLTDLLDNCVNKSPDKRAIVCGDEWISFKELKRRSLEVAYDIVSKGFKSSPIAVVAERSIDTIVNFIGILYSGNYYIPINPEMPEEKIVHIMEETETPIVLSGKSEKCCNLSNTVPSVNINDISYLVYTSGSTGKPKGVIKTHGAILNYMYAFCETFEISDEDIIGNQTPFFFDASAKDIYLMLMKGCTMVIIPSEMFIMPKDLIKYMNDTRISLIMWVPSALVIVSQLNLLSFSKPKLLKWVFFVGEEMPAKHLRKWMDNLPYTTFVNLYGSSEIAGVACYNIIERISCDDIRIPIGIPMKNCEVQLDNGELYIASTALALGYFKDEEKTKATFVLRDFGSGEKRFLKTGDMVEMVEGKLVFVSRNDHQIKFMGRRIELGEIESTANLIYCIDKSCCIFNSTKKKLILYCVLKQDEIIDGKMIKSELKKKLVSYMVPSKVVILDKLPINANGKIDRMKLTEL